MTDRNYDVPDPKDACIREFRAQVKRLTDELDAANREADRLRHGQAIEGDFVCPNELEVTELADALAVTRVKLEDESACHSATVRELNRYRRIVDLVRRWCRRPESVLREGAMVLANDAEIWRKVRAAVAELDATAKEGDTATSDEYPFKSAVRLLAKVMHGGNVTATDWSLASTLFKLAEIEP